LVWLDWVGSGLGWVGLDWAGARLRLGRGRQARQAPELIYPALPSLPWIQRGVPALLRPYPAHLIRSTGR
jgi:hypothetical protein